MVLKRNCFGLSVLLAFVSWLVLGLVWSQVPQGGFADRFISGLFAPGDRAGYFVGAFLFPNYEVRHTTGSYLVPLFGAAGTFIFLTAIFYVCIWLKRAFHASDVDSLPESDCESIRARREDKKHRDFEGEHEPDYVPKDRPPSYGRLGGLLDLVDRERFKLRVWREFHDHTGAWPLLSICFHYAMLIGGVAGTIVFLWLGDNRDFGGVRAVAIGISVAIAYVFLLVKGERWMRKCDWRLFGKAPRNL